MKKAQDILEVVKLVVIISFWIYMLYQAVQNKIPFVQIIYQVSK